jgi:hypothetical protein
VKKNIDEISGKNENQATLIATAAKILLFLLYAEGKGFAFS